MPFTTRDDIGPPLLGNCSFRTTYPKRASVIRVLGPGATSRVSPNTTTFVREDPAALVRMPFASLMVALTALTLEAVRRPPSRLARLTTDVVRVLVALEVLMASAVVAPDPVLMD